MRSTKKKTPSKPSRRPTSAKAKAKAGKASPPKHKKKVSPRKKAAPPAAAVAPRENAAAKALAQKAARLLLDKKALDVVILDVRGKTSYTDYMVVASGESDRQVSAMAEHVETTLKREGGVRTIGTEGQQTGNWVLLDFGEVVVHLFLSEVRSFYDLEGLWTDAPREQVA